MTIIIILKIIMTIIYIYCIITHPAIEVPLDPTESRRDGFLMDIMTKLYKKNVLMFHTVGYN